jgi:hypothetical protein
MNITQTIIDIITALAIFIGAVGIKSVISALIRRDDERYREIIDAQLKSYLQSVDDHEKMTDEVRKNIAKGKRRG